MHRALYLPCPSGQCPHSAQHPKTHISIPKTVYLRPFCWYDYVSIQKFGTYIQELSFGVAVNLLSSSIHRNRRRSAPRSAMTKDFQNRFSAVLLALITLAAGTFAWINFQKERDFEPPDDGIWWVEHATNGRTALTADRVEIASPGEKAGIRPGDVIVGVNEREIHTIAELTRVMYRVGAWSKANYSLER